ncbi:MAG: hypothetical protein M3Y91_03080 [Actinomycetota bacterium]|nr:hypothetical protein [Actinomycetota bacterium]
MSPGKKNDPKRPATGTGPGGRVELSDLTAKLKQIRGEVDDTTDAAKPLLTYGAVAGVVLLVLLTFLLGKRQGRRKSTWVEIRRR